MDLLSRLGVAYRIIIDPFASFKRLRHVGFIDSLYYVLTVGWVTALFSGGLRVYGVDYSNPSNAGGSAQIFAAWALDTMGLGVGLFEVVVFAVLVMIGYIVLALVSALVLGSAVWLLLGRTRFDEYVRLSFVAVVFGMTPGFLFGWVPNPFYLMGLWATLWQALAVKALFGVSWVRALVVVLVWILGVAFLHDLAGYVVSFLI